MSEHDALRMTMSLKDARIVLTALDLYMRIHMGQLSELRRHLLQHIEPGRIKEIEATINRLHALFFPQLGGSPGASFGVANIPHYDARRAYDIYQVLRHREAWTRLPGGPKEHGFSVIFDAPLPVTSDPLPVVERLSLLEQMASIASEEDPKPSKAQKKARRK